MKLAELQSRFDQSQSEWTTKLQASTAAHSELVQRHETEVFLSRENQSKADAEIQRLSTDLQESNTQLIRSRAACDAKDRALEALCSDLKAANEQIRSHVCTRVVSPSSNANTGAAGHSVPDNKSNSEPPRLVAPTATVDDHGAALRQIRSLLDDLTVKLTASQKGKISAELDVIMSDLRAERARRKRYEVWTTVGIGLVAVIFGLFLALPTQHS